MNETPIGGTTAPFQVPYHTHNGIDSPSVTSGTQATTSGTKLRVDTTSATYSNSNTAAAIFTVPIPGGSLDTNNAVHFRIYFQSISMLSGANITFELKYGGSSLGTAVVVANGVAFPASGVKAILEGTLVANGSNNVQIASMEFRSSSPQIAGPTMASDSYGENSDNPLDLIITAKWNTASVNNELIFNHGIATLIT